MSQVDNAAAGRKRLRMEVLKYMDQFHVSPLLSTPEGRSLARGVYRHFQERQELDMGETR